MNAARPASLRFAALVFLGVVGFLLGAAAVREAVPWRPYVEGYTEKIEFYRRHQDRFNLIFLGSSRVFRHIDPLVFDPAAAEAGHPFRSFNFGIDALSLIELRSLVEEILALDPPGLEYILVEPSFVTNIPLRNLTTARTIYFHGWDNARVELTCNLTSTRYRRVSDRTLLAGLYHQANLGRVASVLFPPEEVRPASLTLPALDINAGFEAQDHEPTPERLEVHQTFLDRIDEYDEMIRKPPETPPWSRGAYAGHNEGVLEIMDRIRRSGRKPVLVVTPGFYGIAHYLQFFEHLEQTGEALPVLSYLTGYDDVYQIDYWYDPGHMTGDGARRFSNRLGIDMARLAGRLEGRER